MINFIHTLLSILYSNWNAFTLNCPSQIAAGWNQNGTPQPCSHVCWVCVCILRFVYKCEQQATGARFNKSSTGLCVLQVFVEQNFKQSQESLPRNRPFARPAQREAKGQEVSCGGMPTMSFVVAGSPGRCTAPDGLRSPAFSCYQRVDGDEWAEVKGEDGFLHSEYESRRRGGGQAGDPFQLLLLYV